MPLESNWGCNMYAQQLTKKKWREIPGVVSFSEDIYQTAESLTEDQKNKFNVYLIVDDVRAELKVGQKYGDPVYTVKDSIVLRQYPVVDKSQAEIDSDILNQSNSIRAVRNNYLNECDWTQLNDSNVDIQAWAKYRQLLRNITKQPNFPWAVEWPIKPN
jgi:hypothetical protein